MCGTRLVSVREAVSLCHTLSGSYGDIQDRHVLHSSPSSERILLLSLIPCLLSVPLSCPLIKCNEKVIAIYVGQGHILHFKLLESQKGLGRLTWICHRKSLSQKKRKHFLWAGLPLLTP